MPHLQQNAERSAGGLTQREVGEIGKIQATTSLLELIGPGLTTFGRIGSPRDVAKAIVYLLSDNFGWVTAQYVDVSGGFLL